MTPISSSRTVPVESGSTAAAATTTLLRRCFGSSTADALFQGVTDRISSCSAVLDGDDIARAALVQSRPLSPQRHTSCILGLADTSAEGSHRGNLLEAAARKAAACGALYLSLERGRTKDPSGSFPPSWAPELGFRQMVGDATRWEKPIQ
jgi:hypothetical protein